METTKSITYNSYKELYDALVLAYNHLEWCGYGDKYERECARDERLSQTLATAILNAEKLLKEN